MAAEKDKIPEAIRTNLLSDQETSRMFKKSPHKTNGIGEYLDMISSTILVWDSYNCS